MANDRMFIKCTDCGALCGIAKHFARDWYVPVATIPEDEKHGMQTAAQFVGRLDTFFELHTFCIDGEEYGEPKGFKLVFESDPEEVTK